MLASLQGDSQLLAAATRRLSRHRALQFTAAQPLTFRSGVGTTQHGQGQTRRIISRRRTLRPKLRHWPACAARSTISIANWSTLMNQRAKLAHKIGQIKDTAGQRTYDPGARRRSAGPHGPAEQRAAVRRQRAGRVPRNHQRFAGAGKENARGLSWARPIATAIWRPSIASGKRRIGAGRDASRRCSKRSIAGMPISASCRSKTPPTAASPTRSTCSPACRSKSAAKCKCGSITICWAAAPATRCRKSTASRKPCRSAAIGWPSICRRPERSK